MERFYEYCSLWRSPQYSFFPCADERLLPPAKSTPLRGCCIDAGCPGSSVLLSCRWTKRRKTRDGRRPVLSEAISDYIESVGIGNVLNAPFPDELPCAFVKAFRKKLLSLAENNSASIQEFASTLLAVAVDLRSGNYILLHLGDGCAISIPHACDPIPISAPENGITSHHTQLTTSWQPTNRPYLLTKAIIASQTFLLAEVRSINLQHRFPSINTSFCEYKSPRFTDTSTVIRHLRGEKIYESNRNCPPGGRPRQNRHPQRDQKDPPHPGRRPAAENIDSE